MVALIPAKKVSRIIRSRQLCSVIRHASGEARMPARQMLPALHPAAAVAPAIRLVRMPVACMIAGAQQETTRRWEGRH